VEVAHEYGYEAYHVAHFGLANAEDHHVFRRAVEGNFVVVTNNRDDFTDLMGQVDVHPGLIVLLGCELREGRMRQFKAALHTMRPWADAINKVIEVSEDCDAIVYSLPPFD
jgi:predicted nuclease of predicted toxin-antitoxin system